VYEDASPEDRPYQGASSWRPEAGGASDGGIPSMSTVSQPPLPCHLALKKIHLFLATVLVPLEGCALLPPLMNRPPE
jgi:hypothetical protein